MRFRLFLGCFCLIAALATTTESALAAFPGEDGKIAYSSFATGSDIYTMNPDGTGQTQLTSGPQNDSGPSWSADGRRIAFTRQYTDSSTGFAHNEFWTMNGDGSGQTFIGDGLDPAWSPDGHKMAFARGGRDSEGGGIFVLDLTTSIATKIAPGFRDDRYPEWSPDGQLIVFANQGLFFDSQYIYTVHPDGSNLTRITTGPPGFDRTPTWLPDSSRIAFAYSGSSNPGVWTMNPDGSSRALLIASGGTPAWAPGGDRVAFTGSGNQVSVANADGSNVSPTGVNALTLDWGPVPDAAYVRSKAATPVYAPFVPAYEDCASPNRRHAPPLDFDSCAPPVQVSDHLTLGTPPQDPVNSVGSLRARVLPGDVEFTASVTDVRNQGSLTDYTGELEARIPLRITDKASPPSVGGPNVSATAADFPFSFAVPCSGTSDTTIGSTCAVNTSANVLMPGSVINGNRAMWQTDQVQLYDGGDDALASTTGDNTLFMAQGVFVP